MKNSVTCDKCGGNGYFYVNDTNTPCSKCGGDGYLLVEVTEQPKTFGVVYVRVTGEKYGTAQAHLLNREPLVAENATFEWLRNERGEIIAMTRDDAKQYAFDHKLIYEQTVAPTPVADIVEPDVMDVPVNIKAAFQDDNNDYGDACDWMLTDHNTTFDEAEFERFAWETYDHWANENDSCMSFEEFKRLSDYRECKFAVRGCCENG